GAEERVQEEDAQGEEEGRQEQVAPGGFPGPARQAHLQASLLQRSQQREGPPRAPPRGGPQDLPAREVIQALLGLPQGLLSRELAVHHRAQGIVDGPHPVAALPWRERPGRPARDGRAPPGGAGSRYWERAARWRRRRRRMGVAWSRPWAPASTRISPGRTVARAASTAGSSSRWYSANTPAWASSSRKACHSPGWTASLGWTASVEAVTTTWRMGRSRTQRAMARALARLIASPRLPRTAVRRTTPSRGTAARERKRASKLAGCPVVSSSTRNPPS